MSSAKILIIGPAWIGDMVLAQSLFKALKTLHGESVVIHVMSPLWTAPLLERMPEVSRALPVPTRHGRLDLRVRYHSGVALRKESYQQAIVLPSSFKSALIPYWAGIPRRTGYLGELRYGLLNDIHRLDTQKHPRTADRFLALACSENHPEIRLEPPLFPTLRQRTHVVESNCTCGESPAPPTMKVEKRDFHGNRRLKKPVLALCPGAAYGPAKQWPLHHFITVARAQRKAGWDVWIFGSEKDCPAGDTIVQAAPGSRNFAGKISLSQAIDLLALTEVVLTNDSGLMHVAAALNRKVIALYGSSTSAMTPPLHPEAVTLSLDIPCRPCFKRLCPLKHLRCLEELRPDRVLEILKRI